MNTRYKVICLIVSLTLVLSIALACGQSAEPTSTTPKPAQPSAPQKGGTLKIGVASGIDNIGFAPKLARGDNDNASRPVIESLAHYDKTGNMIAWLATDWKNDAAAKTVTITLRKGVKFHDGTDFNAAAAKWNLDQCLLQKRAELANAKSIDVVDDTTIRVNLSMWDNTILNAVLIAYGKMISPTAYDKNGGENWATLNPVGTGPFKFVSFQRDVKVKYEKFTGYWQQGKPLLDGIEYIMIADATTLLLSLKAGEVDVIEIQPQDMKDLQATGKFTMTTLQTGLGSALTSIMGDGAHADSPFANVNVRKAIAHAIDTKAIINSIYYGQYLATNQWAPPGNWSYNPDVKGYPYDPAKAKQLLADAGYPGGFKTKYSFQSTFGDEAAAVQNYLKAVGIDCQMDPMDTGRWSSAGQNGWTGGFLRAINRADSDVLGQYPKTLSSKPALYGMSIFVPKELDDMIAKAKLATDFETKKTLTRELQKVAFDQYACFAPLHVSSTITAKSPKLHDDGRSVVEAQQWTPEDAWLEK